MFGLKAEIPSNEALNYAGIALIFCSSVAYLFIKPDATSRVDPSDSALSDSTTHILRDENREADGTKEKDIFEKMSPLTQRILGICLAIFSGLMYGQANTPITYVRGNYPDASNNTMDHIFSYYTGILCMSIVYFTIYCVAKKNKPILYPKSILPGLGKNHFFNYKCKYVIIRFIPMRTYTISLFCIIRAKYVIW